MAPGAVLVGQVEVAAKASVWFGAVVHGALVEEGALIGIGAVVLNRARIGRRAVIGAGAVVPPGMEIPAGMLAVGVPAKVRGPVEAPANAPRYQELAPRYRAGLLPVPPAQRYQLTMKGRDALNPFSEVHMELKKHSPAAPAGPGGQPVGQPRARGHPDPPARGPGAGLPAKTPTEECGLAYSFASSGRL